jgi:hypothetical protein
MTFVAVLLLVSAVMTEPVDQRMAPRAVALEIARVARTPLEAAVLVVMAWEEARLIPDAIGDGGKARCAYQLWGAPLSVLRDLRQCTEIAYARLMASWAACPESPIAMYASGSCKRGTRLSARRMAKAFALLSSVDSN